MAIRINSKTTLHQGRVYNLVTENVTLDNGVTTDVEFIQHPGATAIIPVIDSTHIILLKQYRHALRKYIWEIPAGTLDPGESVMNCARRELIEETGFSADQWHGLGEITPVPGYSNERIHIFLATDLHSAERDLDEDEIIQVHRVACQDALAMLRRGDIQDAKSIAGLFLALDWLKFRTFDVP
ncbi:MAG: NUDIX hydrolase [Desulfobacterales bacterium]|jgi:ADP-ribose pyrophosphatase